MKKKIYSYGLNMWEDEDEDIVAHLKYQTVPLKDYLSALIRADIEKDPDSPAHALSKELKKKRIADLKKQIEDAQKELEGMGA
jgi:hypothetical protein